ncbi:MAG: insulinase family protein [Magnetococcus sp. DMHC-6]
MKKSSYPTGWVLKNPNNFFWTLLACYFFLFCTPVTAVPLEYQEETLKNGLRVILVREPKAPVVISQVWYRVGAVDEPEGHTGLAHMLEHMMFQGTNNHPPGEFSRLVAQNGGTDNASTSQDYTNYYIKLSSDRLELALQLESDRMSHLLLAQTEFVSENLVVREERRTRTDSDPTQKMLEIFRAKAFGSHPYGRPVIGSMADIEHHTLEDLKGWYEEYYAPNHAVLVLVGDLEFGKTMALVKKYFAPLKAKADDPKAKAMQTIPPPVTPTTQQRVVVTDANATLPMWFAGFLTPTLAEKKKAADVYALDLLTTILGGGGSSRLYQQLVVKEGLAISVSASYGGIGRYPDLLTLSAIPKPGVELAVLEKRVLEEVMRLTQERVTQRELDRARNGLVAEQIYARDSVYQTAALIGNAVVCGVDWREVLEHYPERISAVTEEEIYRVARLYLDPERATVGILLPQATKE